MEEGRITIAIPEEIGAAIIRRDAAAEQPKMEILVQVIIPASTHVLKIYIAR